MTLTEKSEIDVKDMGEVRGIASLYDTSLVIGTTGGLFQITSSGTYPILLNHYVIDFHNFCLFVRPRVMILLHVRQYTMNVKNG